MRFKIISIIFIMMFCAVSVGYTAEKWNVLIANWEDLSPEGGMDIATIIRRSIISEMSRAENFNVINETNESLYVADWDEARAVGMSNQADVIIYGDFYMENSKLVVFVEVFDVLNGQIKMRNYYTGEATIDLFDTIDSLVSEMVAKVEEALPEIDYESETEIIEMRKMLYQQEEVRTSRMFYTRFGLSNFFGSGIEARWSNSTNLNYQGNYNNTRIEFGLALRYYDVRLNLDLAVLPGLPGYIFGNNGDESYSFSSKFDEMQYSFISATLNYYLPFWDKKFALGAGVTSMRYVIKMGNEEKLPAVNLNDYFQTEGFRGRQLLSLNFIYNPNDKWEFSFSCNPINNYEKIRIYNPGASNEETNNVIISKTEFTPIQLKAMYFPSEYFGVELRYFYSDFYYSSKRKQNDQPLYIENEYWGVVHNIYLGGVYKLDLMK